MNYILKTPIIRKFYFFLDYKGSTLLADGKGHRIWISRVKMH